MKAIVISYCKQQIEESVLVLSVKILLYSLPGLTISFEHRETKTQERNPLDNILLRELMIFKNNY